MFTTPNLIIRGFKSTDSEPLLTIFNDASTQFLITHSYAKPISEARWATMFNDAVHSDNTNSNILKVVLESRETHEVVGQLGLKLEVPKNRDAVLGLVIGKEWHGRGWGTEVMQWVVKYAFEEFALHRVSLEVWADNTQARRLYEKVGFRVEGTKRKGVWFHGGWHDIIYMGILDEDYFEAGKIAVADSRAA